MRPKLFRDPVHNIIAFDQNDPVERVLFELIQTRAFQRLRRVRQLGFANLVYHGAEHTRFTHSLGVAHVARLMFDALGDRWDEDDRMEVLVAALLHDTGHGPFSHAIEKVTDVEHEEYTRQLIDDPSTEVHQVLSSVDRSLPERVGAYFGARDEVPAGKQALRDLVSSQLDADRLDYILRDGLATGVKIGVYDFERIKTMLETYRADADPEGPDEGRVRLAVSHRAREAVEGYLMARFHMFKQVYLHGAVRAAEKMLEAVLRRASTLHAEGRTFEELPSEPLRRLLVGQRLDSDSFVNLDDMDVWMALKAWRRDDDPVLSSLAAGLLDRRLYKPIELTAQDADDVEAFLEEAESLARSQGLDPDYAILLDRAADTPYTPYDPEHGDGGAHIPIITADGRALPIERVSDIVHLLGRDTYRILRVCVHPSLREDLEATL